MYELWVSIFSHENNVFIDLGPEVAIWRSLVPILLMAWIWFCHTVVLLYIFWRQAFSRRGYYWNLWFQVEFVILWNFHHVVRAEAIVITIASNMDVVWWID